jgi:hypothetical protein
MTPRLALIAVVLTHLAITSVHGRAHEGAHIPLPFAGTLFVYIVILAGPLVGLALSRWRLRAGAWIVAMTMAGALVFGLINHFLIDGSDHVSNVVAEWRSVFGTTAVLLLLSEAAGVIVGVWAASAVATRLSDIDGGAKAPTPERQGRSS